MVGTLLYCMIAGGAKLHSCRKVGIPIFGEDVMNKAKVVFGFLGQTMDKASKRRGRYEKRFSRWRPTVSLVQHSDYLPVSRLVLIYHPKDNELKDEIIADIESLAPHVEIEQHAIAFDSPWEIEAVFPLLHRFITSYQYNLDKEEYFFNFSTGSNIQQVSIWMSVGAKHFPGQLVMSAPCPDDPVGSKLKVIDMDNLPAPIAEIFNQQSQEAEQFLKQGIPTKNAAFNEMIQQIERVAIRSKAPMLILGPSGAGKSALARQIFELKKKRHELGGKYVELNCSTVIGESSALAMLFGHTKGAYTGATKERLGLLKQADGGLIFLDEIGDLPLESQTMLLSALETKRFMPLGSDTEVSSDFQIICGTNKDLRVEVSEGRFREDLFFRLNTFLYTLPGLAERREDIEPNLDYELLRYQQENGMAVRMMPLARKRYLEFALSERALWRGNWRDFGSSIIRLCSLSDASVIDVEHVDREIKKLEYLWGGVKTETEVPVGDLSKYLSGVQLSSMDMMEREMCRVLFRVCSESNSAADAGRKLFSIDKGKESKSKNDGARTINMLKKYGLTFEDVKRVSLS